MEEIDKLLKQWILNSIIRHKIREEIVKECFKSFDLGVEMQKDGLVEGKNYKQNTNTNG